MKKIFRRVLPIFMCVGMAFCLTACAGMGNASPDGIRAYGRLVVATNATFPPFEYYNVDSGKIEGWDIEVAEEFAKRLGVELVVENMEFDEVLAAPAQNKAHIAMAGISYSGKRDETLDFTKGVFNSSQVIIVNTGSDIKGPFDLGGKVVGVQRATVGHLLASMDPDWAGEGDDACLAAPGGVQTFDTGAGAVIALRQSRVDAVIIDKFPAQNYVKNYSGIEILDEVIYEDEYAFAVKEGNKTLVTFLNEAIDDLRANGFFNALNNKYFGD